MAPRIRTLLLAVSSVCVSSCYDYATLPTTPNPQGTGSPQGVTPPPAQNKAEEETAKKIEAEAQSCMKKFPDRTAHKADQVRCIISGTDVILDKVHPEGTAQRHALGAYAIQLAEREDRGEITREQAEDLYMQFFRQTPQLQLPPEKEP